MICRLSCTRFEVLNDSSNKLKCRVKFDRFPLVLYPLYLMTLGIKWGSTNSQWPLIKMIQSNLVPPVVRSVAVKSVVFGLFALFEIMSGSSDIEYLTPGSTGLT